MLWITEICFCCVFLYLRIVLFFNSIYFFICPFRISSLRCLSTNFCVMVWQLLSYSLVAEQIAFSLKAGLLIMLFLRDLRCLYLAYKCDFWSVGLQYEVVWILLILSFYSIASRDDFLGVEIWKANLITLCFLVRSSMNTINPDFMVFHNIVETFINIRIDVFPFKVYHESVPIGWSTNHTHCTA